MQLGKVGKGCQAHYLVLLLGGAEHIGVELPARKGCTTLEVRRTLTLTVRIMTCPEIR